MCHILPYSPKLKISLCLFLNNELLVEYSTFSYVDSSFHHHEIQFAHLPILGKGKMYGGATMARDRVVDTDMGEQEELYAVACIHCGKRVFRFSENLFKLTATGYGSGDITLHCPACGGSTIVQGNGEIRTGQKMK
jgi:hypothetical protein